MSAAGAQSGVKNLSPAEAQEAMGAGAVLVDVREPMEHRSERIDGAALTPLRQLDPEALRRAHPEARIIFYCRTGVRSANAAARFASATGGVGEHLAGGIVGWKKAGLPTDRPVRTPIDMMRQVQIGAGVMALLGVGLGALVHPGFYALDVLVGFGLLIAGATGFCGMTQALALLPWNRPRG
ncbi:MAG: rhodanese family protein [Phycisphaerales bacterium JB039]